MRRLIASLGIIALPLFAQPAWVNDPTLGHTVVGAIGLAGNNVNGALKEKIATMRGKRELSSYVNTSIKNKLITLRVVDANGSMKMMQEGSQQHSVTMMKTYVKEQYTDAAGNLYVWVTTDSYNFIPSAVLNSADCNLTGL